MTKKIPICALLLFFYSIHGLYSQSVKEKFDIMSLSENFDSSSSLWTMVANLDNLFIVQDGEYILNRKTLVSPFAVVASYANDVSAFRFVSSLKLEKTANDEGSVGLLFMAQEDGTGGFIIEINKFKQYRVKQITGGGYKYISGEAKNNGWVKSTALSDLNLYNLFDIRTANKDYDIYVNNKYLMSFNEPAYSSGKLGVIIGAGSKAKVDFFYFFTSSRFSGALEEANNPGQINTEDPSKLASSPDIIAFAESIIQLKTQINKLNEENEVYKQTIEAYKSEERDAALAQKTYEKNIKVLQEEMKKQTVRMDSLVKVNNELMKYKELVAGNENSDLIINLSKTLKSEKVINEELRKLNKVQSDSIQQLKMEITKSPGSKGIKQTNTNSSTNTSRDSINQKKGFELPKDGK